MRLWSIHPKYLDPAGLTALWREALLAKAVLEGKTKGYTRHPQLYRFRLSKRPLGSINFYLRTIYDEACRRGYRFDRHKIGRAATGPRIPVNKGQLEYEFRHLKMKLAVRNECAGKKLCSRGAPEPNPLFSAKPGSIEPWEKL